MQSARHKILIVDDDPRNVFALAAVLKTKGFAMATASGGAEGIRLLDEDRTIGLVLMDMMMPEMDGYEAISVIRNGKNREVPVIAVTAQAMVGDREKCLAAGAADYIPKPVDIDVLLGLIKSLMPL